MARRGKPLGNKRQHEQAKARKKREKEARREARKAGPLAEDDGDREGGSGEAPTDGALPDGENAAADAPDTTEALEATDALEATSSEADARPEHPRADDSHF